MNNWDPPRSEDRVDGPTPSARPDAPSWWTRRWRRIPVWALVGGGLAGVAAIAAFVGLDAIDSTGRPDPAVDRSTTTVLSSSRSPAATTTTTTATTTTTTATTTSTTSTTTTSTTEPPTTEPPTTTVVAAPPTAPLDPAPVIVITVPDFLDDAPATTDP